MSAENNVTSGLRKVVIIWPLVRVSHRFLFRNLGAFLQLGWMPILVSYVTRSLLADGRPTTTWYFLALLLGLWLQVWFLVRWYRLVLLNRRETGFQGLWARRNLHFLGYYLTVGPIRPGDDSPTRFPRYLAPLAVPASYIDVQYELEDVITIGAGVEAFFNFNDSTDWHIWIGQKDPESKRVRAAILSIFQVSAYLMIDNNGLLTGAKAALEIRESYGPLTLELALGLSFDAAIFWSPLQLEGRIELFGAIVLKLLGFGIEILLRLMLEAKAPKPFWVHGVAEIKVSLPFPLPSFEAKVEFTWEEPIPPDPIWPLLKGVELGHDLDKEARWLPTGSADVLPIVPVDAIPVAKFSRPLAGRSYARTDEGLSYLGHDEIDDWTFTYVVGRTQLFKVGDAEPVAASPLPGGDIGEMLPLDVSDQSLVTGTDAQQPEWRLWRYDELVSRSTYEREDLAEGLNPCGGLPPPPETCVDFRGLARGRPFARSFTYRGLCFRAKRRPLVRGGRLSVESLWIRFEKPMARVRLELARAATVRAYYDGEQAIAPTGGGAADSVYTILLERDEGIDAVHIEALSALARVDFDLKKVCTLSRDDADDDRRRRRREDDARDAGGDTADRLILEPNSDYRLVIETHVLLSHQGGPNELNESATATDEFFFRTGNGPSAEEPSSGRRTEAESRATPLLAEGEAVTDKHLAGFDYVFGSINDVSRYVGLTLPDEGEPLFYYDLDVEVLFSRLHMSAMYTEGFTFDIQIRDRNGKLIEPELPAFLTQWAFSSPGLMTWLAAADRGGCGDPSRRTGADAVMGSWAAGRLRPNRGYVAELVIRSPSSVRVVHEFSFTTSQYGTPTELLRAGLIEGALLARIESATGATLPAPTLLREAATAYGTLSDKRAVLKLAFDASNRLQTSDLQDETSNLRTAFVTAASAAFEELRSALSLTVDSQVRPPRVELIGHDLGLDAGGLPQLLLRVDGPEPLDWSRFSWTLEQSGVTSPTVLVPIPSADGTTAFFASTDRAVAVPPGEYELTATYLSSDARDLPEHHTRGAVYEPLALELPFQLDASG